VHNSNECEANEANKTPDLAKWSQTRAATSAAPGRLPTRRPSPSPPEGIVKLFDVSIPGLRIGVETA